MAALPPAGRMKDKRATIIIYLTAVAAIVGALKWHYSTSNVNELRWVLAPTTFFVELLGDTNFRFEPYWGYLSDDRTFLIAAPCAGVNFLIVCFLMLAVRSVRNASLKDLPLFLFASYGWTIAANAARIVIALRSRDEFDAEIDPDTLHRVEGILIYFVFLVGLYFLAETLERRRKEHAERPSFLVVAVPLLCYYFVALALPIMNGSFDDSKVEHFFTVLLVPLGVAVPIGVLSAVMRSRRRRV